MWAKAQWEGRSKAGVGIKVVHRWCLHRRRGSAGASVKQEGSQMMLLGSLGRSQGRGGTGLCCAKALPSNFTSRANTKTRLLWLSSGEVNDLPLTESKSEPETDMGAGGELKGGASEVAADPGVAPWGNNFNQSERRIALVTMVLCHSHLPLEVPNHYQTASQY